jgi:hypothetical protein
MLFRSDYWLATNHTQQTETIVDFLDSEECVTELIIVDVGGTETTNAIVSDLALNEEIECSVKVYTENETKLYECVNATHTKNIYVRRGFDHITVNIMKTICPILAIFV